MIAAAISVLSCSPRPAIYFKPDTSFRPVKKLAILPFSNYSGKEDAGKQITNAFLVELLKKPFLVLIEPGEVEKALREERVRSTDKIDFETAALLREKLGVDLIMIGAVNEYDYMQIENRQIPRIGVSVRILDATDGSIVWAGIHSRKGDDTELVFGWGLVKSLTQLSRICARDMVGKLKIED